MGKLLLFYPSSEMRPALWPEELDGLQCLQGPGFRALCLPGGEYRVGAPLETLPFPFNSLLSP